MSCLLKNSENKNHVQGSDGPLILVNKAPLVPGVLFVKSTFGLRIEFIEKKKQEKKSFFFFFFFFNEVISDYPTIVCQLFHFLSMFQ